MITKISGAAPGLVGTVAASATAFGQVSTNLPPVADGAKPVTVERIKVHGKALEGNLEGNAADRDILVLMPPSYRGEPTRRYPVVYARSIPAITPTMSRSASRISCCRFSAGRWRLSRLPVRNPAAPDAGGSGPQAGQRFAWQTDSQSQGRKE